MDSLFGGGAKKTLRMMVKKGLIKVDDLDTPPSGWFIAMGYDRENKTSQMEKTTTYKMWCNSINTFR